MCTSLSGLPNSFFVFIVPNIDLLEGVPYDNL